MPRQLSISANHGSGFAASHSSILGQLVMLASLRDPNTGAYKPATAARQRGSAAGEVSLARHERVFARWLMYTLEEQATDLERYLERLGGNRNRVLLAWREMESYRAFIPQGATSAERSLFLCDFKVILSMMAGPETATAPPLSRRSRHGCLPQILDWVHQEPMSAVISLKVLSHQFRLSPRTIGRRFRLAIGMPFRRYVRAVKMRYAANLLATTPLSITAVAQEFRYTTVSNFTRDFRSVFAVTPAQYRAGGAPIGRAN